MTDTTMTDTTRTDIKRTDTKKLRVPPPWFMRAFWSAHRWLFRVTHGRVGLWRSKQRGWGALQLTATGRRSGAARSVMLGYLEDGPNFVTMAMNGCRPGDPAWWRNLQANPAAHVESVTGPFDVVAHEATGEERARLWQRWQEVDGNMEAMEARRQQPTPIVVLEPQRAA